jgi:hypothetical protein
MSKMLVRLNNTESAGFGLYTAMNSKVSLPDCVSVCKVVEEMPNEMPMGMKYSEFKKHARKKAIKRAKQCGLIGSGWLAWLVYRLVIQAIFLAVNHWLDNNGSWTNNENPNESESDD